MYCKLLYDIMKTLPLPFPLLEHASWGEFRLWLHALLAATQQFCRTGKLTFIQNVLRKVATDFWWRGKDTLMGC